MGARLVVHGLRLVVRGVQSDGLVAHGLRRAARAARHELAVLVTAGALVTLGTDRRRAVIYRCRGCGGGRKFPPDGPARTRGHGGPCRKEGAQRRIDSRCDHAGPSGDPSSCPARSLSTRPHQESLGTDLIVWPEAAVPTLYDYVKPYPTTCGAPRRRGSTVLLGILRTDPRPRDTFQNVLIALTGATALRRGTVPFGEYFPCRSSSAPG